MYNHDETLINKEYKLIKDNIIIPNKGKIYAINESNKHILKKFLDPNKVDSTEISLVQKRTKSIFCTGTTLNAWQELPK